MVCSVMVCSVMVCSVMVCSVMVCSVMVCSVMVCSVMVCSVMVCSVMVCSHAKIKKLGANSDDDVTWILDNAIALLSTFCMKSIASDIRLVINTSLKQYWFVLQFICCSAE